MHSAIFINSDNANYLANEMSFDVAHIANKLQEFDGNDRKLILEIISSCVEISKQTIATFDYIAFTCKPVIKKINGLLPCKSKFNNTEAHLVADAIRFSFTHFVIGGLLNMYEYQENECWHPKIIISKTLEPNDILDLPEIVIIYRGCDRNELENEDFGQAWTTDPDVAKRFAFEHYSSQDWFVKSNRIVLKASISREDVFYSKSRGELEVVINPKKILLPSLFEA